MLISEDTKKSLNRLVQQGFILNRIVDRGVSCMSVDFAMNNFAKIFHPGLAHRYPVDVSDFVGEILDQFNELTDYDVTPADNSVYSSPTEFFEKHLKYVLETVDLFNESVEIAKENKEYHIVSELEKIITNFNQFVNQAILLVDKVKIYNGDWASFDNHCDKFFIL